MYTLQILRNYLQSHHDSATGSAVLRTMFLLFERLGTLPRQLIRVCKYINVLNSDVRAYLNVLLVRHAKARFSANTRDFAFHQPERT